MSVHMTKNKKELVVTCDCKCGQSFGVSVDDDWKDDGYYAFLCFYRNNCYTEHNSTWETLKTKAKKIWYVIRGKDYCYSDTIMTKDDYEEFKSYINQF